LLLGALAHPLHRRGPASVQRTLRDAGVAVLALTGLGLVWRRLGDLLARPFARIRPAGVRRDGSGLVLGLGLGLVFVSDTIAAVSGVADREAGLASGLINTTQQVGGALGLAVLSSIAASTTGASHDATHAAALVDGFQLAFLVGAGLMLAGAVVIVGLLRRHHVEAIGAEDVAVAVPA